MERDVVELSFMPISPVKPRAQRLPKTMVVRGVNPYLAEPNNRSIVMHFLISLSFLSECLFDAA
ncbi:MAG: hypothetical protein OIN86_00605 [Candidatus Methanoperedens sp.]|nr:hypothetical protein [Candidatus Methanoperedens sp.]